MESFDVEKIGLLLSSTARTWRTKLDRRLKPLGLSQGKWTTLAHLANAERDLTQRELAELVGIEGPTLAGILDRLQNDGWIQRRDSAADRRCKTVHLRRTSSAILGQIFSTAHTLRHELLADIAPADLQTCMKVLQRIRERAETADFSAQGRILKRNGSKPRRLRRTG
jgi:MarR family transcriptional regulator for hemolysin